MRFQIVVPHRYRGNIAFVALARRRHFHFQQNVFLPPAIEMVDKDPNALPGNLRVPTHHPNRANTGKAVNLRRNLLGHHRQRPAEFIVKHPCQIARLLGKIMAAVGIIRQFGHQILIVTTAQPDGRHGNPILDQRTAQRTKLIGTLRAYVSQSVRQQYHPVYPLHPAVDQKLAQFFGALAHPGKQRGTAPGIDAPDSLKNTFLIRRFGCRHQNVYRRVVGHHGNNIIAAQPADRHDRRLPRLGDLLTAHRTGFVDHNRDIHRRPLLIIFQGKTGQPDPQIGRLFFVCQHRRLIQCRVQIDLRRRHRFTCRSGRQTRQQPQSQHQTKHSFCTFHNNLLSRRIKQGRQNRFANHCDLFIVSHINKWQWSDPRQNIVKRL